MAGNKTQATTADVADFLDSVPDPKRRADAKAVAAMMERVSGEPPVLWGRSILGFGRYQYRYESGREGEMARIGFSPRAKELVLYLIGGFARHQALMDRLGRVRLGKSCLYLRSLDDIDREVLEQLFVAELDYMRETYPNDPPAEPGGSLGSPRSPSRIGTAPSGILWKRFRIALS